MLRPATPLAIIFFLAFVLLLLSTISTPIIKQIPLGSYQGYDFGVFGWCNGDNCEGPRIGYTTDGLFTGANADDFSLPSTTRTSLSSILIVHPIAALLVLICFSLAVAAHFHAPGHSPRFLLALLILTIPTLLITLLAFLVDILLFVPHVEWGGWIMLAATILIVASSVVTCAMRRTLVSRKARKKRIAENADMNGQNYYENLNQQRMLADQLPRADSPPPMSGTTQIDDPKAAQFAAFEMKRQETNSQDGGRRSNDDRTPLNPMNPARDPSIRSASTGGASRRPGYGEGHPPMPMNGRPGADQGMGGGRPSRDEYGNPLPPMMAAGMAGELPPPGLRHHTSQGSLGSNGSARRGGAPPPGYMRGRGGYGPPPRGYGPPRGGAYGPRGGYGPPRGGYGPRGGFRGGPPPPGWNGRGRGGYGPQGPGPRGPPPPGYGADPYYGPQGGLAPVERQRSNPMQDQFVGRGPSPSGSQTIGQAIEMDERTGSPPDAVPHQVSPYGLRDSDSDVGGMVGLQQDQPVGNGQPGQFAAHDDPTSPTSMYSRGVNSQYVPPRAGWAQGGEPNGPVSPPLRENTTSAIPSSNVFAGTHGFPTSQAPLSPIAQHDNPSAPRHVRGGSEHYYEDVDPRFASDPHVDTGADQRASGLPSALQPGGNAAYRMPSPISNPPIPTIVNHSPTSQPSLPFGPPAVTQTDHLNSTPPLEDGHGASGGDSNENLPAGMRSPTGSDTSHFTSISQRGINPAWRPGPGSYANGSTASAAQRRREDVVLAANPDFSLPGLPSTRGGRARRGGPLPRGGGVATGLTPSGRYPMEL